MPKAPTYRAKWPVYAKQWDKTAVKPDRTADIRRAAARLVAAKDRYLKAEKLTGVPWYMIAALHWRESSGNFKTQLAQGDPLNRRSTHVPRDRGPFKTWEDGAYDALVTLKRFNRVKSGASMSIASKALRVLGLRSAAVARTASLCLFMLRHERAVVVLQVPVKLDPRAGASKGN